MRILVTGAAGFIGFHLIKQLLERGDSVIGIDNINDYYDVNLKYGRLQELGIPIDDITNGKAIQSIQYADYQFIKIDLSDQAALEQLFTDYSFDKVCNLAAQAGVRYSLINPHAYVSSNLVGFVNLLECCRHHKIKHMVYASSSSVYGFTKTVPFTTNMNTDEPVSLYAATKKSNELMAYTYSHLYGLPTTGLRFFTVYGPWGRPDMACFLFTDAILKGVPIKVFNHGNMSRDFTYIDDIVEGVIRVVDRAPTPETVEKPPYKVYNIGNNSPIKLMDFIECIEEELEIKAEKNFMPLQAGDVLTTWADVDELIRDFNYQPTTSIKKGVKEFVKWYKQFYKVKSKKSLA